MLLATFSQSQGFHDIFETENYAKTTPISHLLAHALLLPLSVVGFSDPRPIPIPLFPPQPESNLTQMAVSVQNLSLKLNCSFPVSVKSQNIFVLWSPRNVPQMYLYVAVLDIL